MLTRKIRLATVFSGIGAIESALKYLNIDHEIVFACDNGERILSQSNEEIQKLIDGLTEKEKQTKIKELYAQTGKPNLVKDTFFANYDIDEDRWFEDIRYLNAQAYKGTVDLFVGGSPCQSFSYNGKQAGLNDVRGTLFYEYARIVNECLPKVFIYENVRGMLTHDKGNTWNVVKGVFESLNYDIFIKKDESGKESPILNAKNYGIPQSRDRLFIVGFRADLGIKNFKFPNEIKLTKFVSDFLDDEVDAKYYLGQKGFEFVTTHPSRAQVSEPIMRCQKANQQFNWNGDFIFEPIELVSHRADVLNRAYVGEWSGEIGVTRKFTPRECLRLMGFRDDFVMLHKDEVMYRQAGNSIVVNVLMELVKEIDKTNVWNLKLKLATLFSGIGAVEQALIRMHKSYDIVFACDNGEIEIDVDEEEIKRKVFDMSSKKEKKTFVDELYASKSRKQNYVKQSYLANYPIDEENFHLDIRFLDGRDYEGKVDLLVGGSPCQSFSTVGFQGGLDDTRGTLFYEYARIIQEVKPKVFIFENVRGLTTHDNGKTWGKIKDIFMNTLHYNITEPQVLNAADYGIPQTRRRLFVVGIRDDIEAADFEYPIPLGAENREYCMQDFLEDNCAYDPLNYNFYYDEEGRLIVNNVVGIVDPKYTLTPKVRDYVLASGTKGFKTSTNTDLPIARTLLKTMTQHHRAGVDNYITVGYDDNGVKMVRSLTERECLRLMGFPDSFNIVVTKFQMLRQAGNSIVVDVMMAILNSIFDTGVL